MKSHGEPEYSPAAGEYPADGVGSMNRDGVCVHMIMRMCTYDNIFNIADIIYSIRLMIVLHCRNR